MNTTDVTIAPKVAVREEASVAFDAWWRREMSYLSSADRAFAKTAWCAALESFASRMGSGERDAVDAARYRWLRCQGNREHAARLLTDRMNVDEGIDAAIAQQADKRGGA